MFLKIPKNFVDNFGDTADYPSRQVQIGRKSATTRPLQNFVDNLGDTLSALPESPGNFGDNPPECLRIYECLRNSSPYKTAGQGRFWGAGRGVSGDTVA